ncbi:MAG: hypothetical protein QXS00_10245 [Pyrobaculum sp.]
MEAVTRWIWALLLVTGAAYAASSYWAGSYLVVNLTEAVEAENFDYIFNWGNCTVYVTVYKSIDVNKKNGLMLPGIALLPQAWQNYTLAELAAVLDGALQVLGNEFQVGAEVIDVAPAAFSVSTKGWRAAMRVQAQSLGEFVEGAARELGATKVIFYTGREVSSTSVGSGGRERLVYITYVVKNLGDVLLEFSFYPPYFVVKTSNFTKAKQILEKIESVVGDRVRTNVYVGRVLTADDWNRLRSAAEMWAWERGQRKATPCGGLPVVGSYGGSLVVVYLPTGNTASVDRAMAEQYVRRFVELAGLCPSPLVAAIGPEACIELPEDPVIRAQKLAALASAIAAFAAGLTLKLSRRRG